MNIYDISKVAGVSIASVSRVINGAENVSEKTRKKVLDVIDQYGYTPNAYARGLGRGSMKTIGIMCSDPTDMYLASAINFLETELRSQGYNSILCCTGFELENKKASFELLKSRQVDAFILVGSQFIEPNPEDNAYIIEGAREHPVMILNGYLEGENIYCTVCDEQGGMRNALHQLYDTGARKFVYVYSSVSYSGTQKLAGLHQGIAELGLPQDALRTVHGHRRFDEMAQLLKEAFPDCALTTDMIVGFPGETEEEFQQSLEFLPRCGFAHMHIFPYSRREGTPAAAMPDQVPKQVKAERAAGAAAAAEELRLRYNTAMLGTVAEVLFEQTEDGLFTGHAPNGVKVYAKGEALHNELRRVLLRELRKDGVFGVLLP